MGYHEIETVTRYNVRCRDCAFVSQNDSQGQAENAAIGHIEEYVEKEGSPYFSHVLTIAPVTLIGRQP